MPRSFDSLRSLRMTALSFSEAELPDNGRQGFAHQGDDLSGNDGGNDRTLPDAVQFSQEHKAQYDAGAYHDAVHDGLHGGEGLAQLLRNGRRQAFQ